MRRYANGRKKKYNAYSTKQPSEPSSTTFTWSDNRPRRSNAEQIKSLQTSKSYTSKPEPKQYTGTLVKGISTMHKSNAVPIINEQELIDHANMRR